MGILDNINTGKTTLHTFNRALVQSLGMVKLGVQVDFYHLVTFHLYPLENRVSSINGYIHPR
ncbi:hypothetical protein DVH24_039136 [Malus domestica]|uniref:Uncharacterized protein n=1 Tax=Malus domestica TaxID=3750 RepID=A0A498KH24_MALDO|nr:hypothetical protein DVH24_039136 [Malus domestica]